MIVEWPDNRLETPAVDVTEFGLPVRELADRMLIAMQHHRGIGLAACQIGDPRRVAVLHPGIVMVNPRITKRSGTQRAREGCLSFPGETLETERSDQVWVDYQTVDGRARNLAADGLLSVCIQHEVDHLDGIVFHHRVANHV